MAVVILNRSIRTVVVGVESLAIPRSFVVAHFVELDNSVVAAPRPDSCCRLSVGKHFGTVSHKIIFNNSSVATDGHDSVAGHLFNEIIPHYDISARMPVFTAPWRSPDNAVSFAAPYGAVFNCEAVEYRNDTVFIPSAFYKDARSPALFFDQTAVDIMDIECVKRDSF